MSGLIKFKSENDVKNEVILVLMECQNYLRFWVNPTGTTKIQDRFVSFGLVGSSDILGISRPNGRFIAIELKSSSGKLSNVQKNFNSMVVQFGGVSVIAHPKFASKYNGHVGVFVISELYSENVISMDLFDEIRTKFVK